jgi:hypothetical protein
LPPKSELIEFRSVSLLNATEPTEEAMAPTGPRAWQSVNLPPLSPIAAIGEALRRAFPIDAATRSLRLFERLLTRLL